MASVYENEYPVGVIHTDMFDLCRPSSLLNFLQEAATEHVNLLGIGMADLMERGAVWMLVRMKYTLERPVRGGERLRVRTSYRPPKGAFVFRDFELYAGRQHIGGALSTWVLGDVNSHALLKAEEILPAVGCAEASPGEKLGKIPMPRELDDAGARTVGYSDTDVNGHANNTRYADYACDAIHFERRAGQYVRRMQLTYSAECLAGQTIALRSRSDGNVFYVRGLDEDGKPHFDIRMELDEI